MIVPNSSFRPDPQRAIYLDGAIDDEQVSKLTPQILALQSKNRDPITVFILNSPGGSVASMEAILRLLNSSDQNFAGACQIITVVTARAASAAADLLASGDYAVAYPGSTILYHGIRTPLRAATAEQTSMMAHYLRVTNDFYAMELARKIEFRFMYRFTMLKSRFIEIRKEDPNKVFTDVDCFLELISRKLSEKAKKVFDKAVSRYGRYEALLNYVSQQSIEPNSNDPQAKIEGSRIKAIVDFEITNNKADSSWTFKDGGIARVADDFFILNEYLDTQASDRLLEWCKTYGRFALSREDIKEFDEIVDESARDSKMIEKVRPFLQPVLSFFVAFCHALQEGENELTATDAYWLGLVDEVMGRQTLSAFRLMIEHEPDPSPQAEQRELQPGTDAAL